MQNASKMGRIVAVLVVIVVIGLLIGWWASRDATAPVVLNNPEALVLKTPKKTNSDGTPVIEQAQAQPVEMPEAEPVEPPPTWEDKLDKILLDDTVEADKKAAGILALMKENSTNEAVQVELSQHLINMVQDDNYAETGQILTNSLTPAAVSSILMNDLLNRNNNLKLPTLLDIASNDYHPLKGEAKEMLELFVQEEHGTNWEEWKTAIENWIKENPQ